MNTATNDTPVANLIIRGEVFSDHLIEVRGRGGDHGSPVNLGAQRFCSLGYATLGSVTAPQDGIEPLRRMGKWIINEDGDPDVVPPPWLAT